MDVTTQLTPGARAAIEGADLVLYGLTEPLSALRVEALNPQARSLDGYYATGKDRRLTYAEMVDAIVTESLRGSSVCVVLYGHPGFFAAPGHEAIRQVRANGLRAQMLPGVSALDCLFADLGIDPGRTGLQAYEATYFYRTQPPLDPRATLALLQVGMLGEEGGTPTAAVSGRFPLLVEMLRTYYGEGSEAILYEASQYPGTPSTIVRFQLRDRELPRPATLATLCITPP